MDVTTRKAIHALIEELEEGKLELAKQALEELRDDGFDLTAEEERTLLEREAECAHGDKLEARAFLAELRREDHADSNG